jgi:hypothetical protein
MNIGHTSKNDPILGCGGRLKKKSNWGIKNQIF